MFPHIFIMPFRVPHLTVPFTSHRPHWASLHKSVCNGPVEAVLCSLPQALASPSESLHHILSSGRSYFGYIYFSSLKSYYDICPLISSLPVNVDFLIFTFIYSSPSPFCIFSGVQTFEYGQRWMYREAKKLQVSFVQAPYKALHLILIFLFF